VQAVVAGAGVAARLGVAPGAHHGDTQWNQPVAKARRFAGGEDDAGVWHKQAQRTDGLNEVAVIEVGQWLEFAGAWTEARQ
ncbi:uncharacterized protein METZ01_LOCUS252492, partial [marine metagenome]